MFIERVQLLRVGFLLLILWPALLVAQDNEQVLTIGALNDNVVHKRIKQFLGKAYKRIGISVHFVPLPSRRSLYNANSGEIDGDAGRIKGTDSEYPNLVPIPTPVYRVRGIAFTNRAELPQVQNWNDLKAYRVGIIRGIRYAEEGTYGLQRFFANDTEHLFGLLTSQRIDIAVTELDDGINMIQTLFPESAIRPIGGILYEGELYHFINKKHQHLVGEIDTAIKDLINTMR